MAATRDDLAEALTFASQARVRDWAWIDSLLEQWLDLDA